MILQRILFFPCKIYKIGAGTFINMPFFYLKSSSKQNLLWVNTCLVTADGNKNYGSIPPPPHTQNSSDFKKYKFFPNFFSFTLVAQPSQTKAPNSSYILTYNQFRLQMGGGERVRAKFPKILCGLSKCGFLDLRRSSLINFDPVIKLSFKPARKTLNSKFQRFY